MSKKFGLGKGLSALIPEEINSDYNDDKQNIFKVSLNKIKPNPKQPREKFSDDKIKELSESIDQYGIIQPLILKKEDSIYVIIAGERRWRAAKTLGLKEVPAIIKELTDKEELEISLIENIQREDLNSIEEAKAYDRLIKEFFLTQEELSQRLGKSRTTITNTLRLLKLENIIQDLIIQNKLSEGHARALLSLKKKEHQLILAEKIIHNGLSVRDVEKKVKKLNEENNNNEIKKVINKNNIYYKEIENRLQEYLGTKVSVNNRKNKGKIEIEYYSQDDLQRILDIIKL